MTETNRKLKVFLCHASEDKPAVRELYKRLNAEAWIDSWLDEESLLPGQDWDLEIYKATRDADAIIIFLSEKSVQKEGYVNKEIRRVLDIANEKPEGTIYIIPLRLDECTPSFVKLTKLHWLDYFEPNAHQRLIKSLKLRAGVLKIEIKEKPRRVLEEKKPEKIREFMEESSPVEENPFDGLDLYIPPEYDSENFVPPPAAVPSWHFGEMEFVKIPHGAFLMGSADDDKEAYGDEKPQHKINLRYDFLMARFPVTNSLFKKFAEATDHKTKAEKDGFAWVWDGKEWNKTKGASWHHPKGAKSDLEGKTNHPVAQIFWQDATAFCEWLNKKYPKRPRGLVFRLPSELEWEKAARGTEGLIYPWGNEFEPENCNWRESAWGGTSPVGIYSPRGDSPFGCADMSGNTWEWTASLWGKESGKPDYDYPYKPRDGRENQRAEETVLRVLRGGSFYAATRDLRAAVRDRDGGVSSYFGFRVALAPRLS
jgi:formylglycine-generating enzyme required for sulfatase activity